jgi:hypothetical protein
LDPKDYRLTRKQRKSREEEHEYANVPYHDRIHHRLIWDIFRREWGTEVLVYVWWVGRDAIVARPLEGGFIIVFDLGPEQEVLVGERTVTAGGRWYCLYWGEDADIDVPEPELGLEEGVLSAKFYGFEIPERGSSAFVGREAGRLSIEHLADQWIKKMRGLKEGTYVPEPRPY